MNISATATARIFRVLTERTGASQYPDKSYFIIFLRHEPESTRSRALKTEFIARRAIRAESRWRRKERRREKERERKREESSPTRNFHQVRSILHMDLTG